MAKVTIMRGVPGSGKSTCAKMLQSLESNTIIASADDYFLDLETGEYKFNPSKLGVAHTSCYLKIIVALSEGKNVIVDNTNITNWQIAPYIMHAAAMGHEIEIFEVKNKLTVKELAERNIHGVPEQSIKRMMGQYEELLPHWKEYAKDNA
jgi:predicted kinase